MSASIRLQLDTGSQSASHITTPPGHGARDDDDDDDMWRGYRVTGDSSRLGQTGERKGERRGVDRLFVGGKLEVNYSFKLCHTE